MTTETETTHKEAADAARRYVELKGARYVVTSTGETFTADEMKRELEKQQAIIKPYIEANGPMKLEGIARLRLQERSGGWSWDVNGMYENGQADFQRVLEIHALTIDEKVMKAQEQAGGITGVRQRWAFEGAGAPALIVEKAK